MRGVLASDWIKFRKTWIPALVVLGPVGVVSLTGVHYAVSYSEMVQPGANNWAGLIQNINFLLIPALVLGLTLIASLMTGLEHQGHTWKQLLAIPVPRHRLYLGKLFWLLMFLACSGALAVIGTVVLAWLLGLHGAIPWSITLQEGFGPYVASYALMGLQLMLSVLVANQGLAISVGVIGVIASFARSAIPAWIPWVYPGFAAPYGAVHPSHFLLASLAVCLGLLVAGLVWFAKHQVK